MSGAAHLSAKDCVKLKVESRIAPEVIAREIAENRLRTINHSRELPRGFSRRQRRRGAGILFTMPRPNGEVGYSFRPDDPDPENPGRKYEQPCKALGGSGNVLGVYETIPGLLGDASAPLVFVEGAKKGLSLLSWARSASRPIVIVVISGVWNWLSKGAPIPDMLALPIEGRECRIAFDSDWRSKINVHDALARLDAYLKSRGGAVLIWNIPHTGDGKTGLDDYRATGGDVEELEQNARPFVPVDVGAERLSQDEKLGTLVGHLLRLWREYDWICFVGKGDKGNWARGHTARDVKEALIQLAPRIGKLDGDAVEVEAGLRRIAELAAKSKESVRKALDHLEADGQIEILPPKDKSKSRRYQLIVDSATIDSMEREAKRERFSRESDPRCQPLRYPSAPRLRWSAPGRPRRREFEVVTGTSRVRHTGQTPRDALSEDLEATPYVKRLGPHRGAVLDTLEAAGGELHLKELCEALHRGRPWDVRRRILKPLEEARIVECEGDIVRLAAGWQTSLDKRRDEDGEIEQAERQAEKHRKEGTRYREHLAREKRGTPEASLAAVRRTKGLREKRLREIREEEERDRAPTTPAIQALVTRILSKHNRMRMGLLCGIAMDEGLRWRDVPPAVRRMGYRIERLAEYDNAEFIFAREAAA